MTKISELKKKLMNNAEFREEYRRADFELQLLEEPVSAPMTGREAKRPLSIQR